MMTREIAFSFGWRRARFVQYFFDKTENSSKEIA